MVIWWMRCRTRGFGAGRTPSVCSADVEHLLQSNLRSRWQFCECPIRAIVIEGVFRRVMPDVVRHGLESIIVCKSPVVWQSVKLLEAFDCGLEDELLENPRSWASLRLLLNTM